MSKPVDEDDAVRVKCQVLGENCYVLVGKKSLMICLPYENRREMESLRETVEAISSAVTRGLERLYGEEGDAEANSCSR